MHFVTRVDELCITFRERLGGQISEAEKGKKGEGGGGRKGGRGKRE